MKGVIGRPRLPWQQTAALAEGKKLHRRATAVLSAGVCPTQKKKCARFIFSVSPFFYVFNGYVIQSVLTG